MTRFVKPLAVLVGLFGLISAWQPGHECPESLTVMIPNNQEYISEGERYGMIWDEHDNVGSGIARFADIHTVLLYCPSIRDLDVHPKAEGCTEFPERYNIPWSLDGKDQIPALESITLTDYEFDQREWDRIKPPQEFVAPTEDDTEASWLSPWKAWFHTGKAETWFDARNLPKEQREKTNLDLWLDLMDWTKLKSLKIKEEFETPQGQALFERLPKMVPGLESLMVKGPWWETVPILGETDEAGQQATQNIRRARDFILAFPKNSLKSLSWLNSYLYEGSDYLQVLEHLGQGLTSLEWRDAEKEYGRRPVFSPSQIREISTLAPNLESLTIDVNRNGTWPLEELTAVVENFPKLRNLTLYFELVNDCYRNLDYYPRSMFGPQSCEPKDCPGWGRFERPLLDEDEAQGLFEFLRQTKVGDELTSVTFRAGDWDPEDHHMASVVTFLWAQKAYMDCTMLNTDGSKKSEEVHVCQGRTVELSPREKKRLALLCEERDDLEGGGFAYEPHGRDEL